MDGSVESPTQQEVILHNPLLLAAVVVATAPSLAFGQTTEFPSQCTPSQPVMQALSALPDLTDYSIPYEDRMGPLRALAGKYPRDVFVQHRYQDAFKRGVQLHEEFDRAFAMYRSKPGDPILRYFEARLTAAFDAAAAETMFADVLRSAPTFPWPHLGIAELTDRDGARDSSKAEAHLSAFLAACPGAGEGYAMLRTVENRTMLADGAVKLRTILDAAVPTSDLLAWRYLWELEFRIASPAEQEAVRQRVVRDVEGLLHHQAAGQQVWFTVLQDAARLTRDSDLQNKSEMAVMERFPGSPLAAQVEGARWSREHPRPPRNAKPEDVQTHLAARAAWQSEFNKRWSTLPSVVVESFMTGARSTAPLDERLAVVDQCLALVGRSPDSQSSASALITAADRYVRWGTRLDQVPAMIQAGLKQAELEATYRKRASMYSQELWSTLRDDVNGAYSHAYMVLADLYLGQHQLNQARDVIEQGTAALDLRPVYPPGTPDAAQDLRNRRRSWMLREARLAELSGDQVQALAIFRRYVRGVDKEALANLDPRLVGQEAADVIPRIKTLYLASGGSEDRWIDWATTGPVDASSENALPPLVFNAALPDFVAKDLSGRTWRLSDLKGKATFIDVWATWCGTCREHHPQIQQLHDRLKGRGDVQMLSLSWDDNAYTAAAYMKEMKYTFPVIASKEVAEKLFPTFGLPAYWIIDALGRRSSPYYWWNEQDVDRIVADLERASTAK
jgi:thiol-disulfide isomerase/thioredoxin